MDGTAVSSQKLQKVLISSWNLVNEDFKKYLDNVNLGEKYTLLIIDHKTTLHNIVSVNIEHTDLFKMKPEIHSMLMHSIENEIMSEETHLQDILSNLHSYFVNIVVQIDKIFNVYRSVDLKTCELLKASETSLSFAEMLEALDRFKRFFTENHNGRKYSLDILHSTEDLEKISSLWNVSELISLKKDLDLILTME